MRNDTQPLGYFEALYAARPDPWHLETSPYEHAKYEATLAALPRPRYSSALEVGCARGVFTAALASCCAALLAIEPVGLALAEARTRNAGRPWVRFAQMFVPAGWPDGRFDLIVLSEVIDYLGKGDVSALARRLAGTLDPGGDVVLVHWVGKKSGHPSGQEASDLLITELGDGFEVLRGDRNADYRLDVLRRG